MSACRLNSTSPHPLVRRHDCVPLHSEAHFAERSVPISASKGALCVWREYRSAPRNTLQTMPSVIWTAITGDQGRVKHERPVVAKVRRLKPLLCRARVYVSREYVTFAGINVVLGDESPQHASLTTQLQGYPERTFAHPLN